VLNYCLTKVDLITKFAKIILKKMIPFSPPFMNEEVIAEVTDALRSGWITTGPKTKSLEKIVAEYVSVNNVLCLNSATAGLELMLRWFGVKEGDEVIVPVYTYSATANVVMHCGAKPVMVDVSSTDFNINIEKIKKAITEKTKAILPVDFAGYPCDYDAINKLINEDEIKLKFNASNEVQKKLGRIIVISDAAHSLGAYYKGKRTGSLCDATVFSFHAVKNLTTAEGGALCINLPKPFINEEIYKSIYISSLHGQTKDALAKTQKGAWEYDIIEAGYKCNMPDISAAIGIAQFKYYEPIILPRRKKIFEQYNAIFEKQEWAITPKYFENDTISSFHVYPLRIKNISIEQRNEIIQKIFDKDVSVNVHFKPLPLLSVYKNAGYQIENYPTAMQLFSSEISLPVFADLNDEMLKLVTDAVIVSVNEVLMK
jgi:dTDP-4-amino-4,6-dideoxygalactose transaminase